ncbi:MAG: sugar phosphate isomerase/epimerase family protein, partial [Planctomycetota bacterium]
EVGQVMDDCGLTVSGMAVRYYSLPAFKAGAFTNPDKAIRRAAIDVTKKGIDTGRELGAKLMTIWPGQDGYESFFQADYGQLWDYMLEGLAEVADHDPECDISLEYKPDEPRPRALLPDCATTLLLLSELGRPNIGVTLDFAHSLYAGETPAFAAALIARRSRLLGLHLNDGYGHRDDGLMVGSVNPQATLELLIEARRVSFNGPIYFDTFPNTADLDPIAECEANIAMTDRLLAAAERIEGGNRLRDALERQNPVDGLTVAHEALFRN